MNRISQRELLLSNASLQEKIFGSELVLLKSANELFELELAFLESQLLSKNEMIARAAFFKTIDGTPSNHFLMCQYFNSHFGGGRSSATRAYFEEGRYSTGYATHSLFPYRGKFHPQLIKALLNIMGVRKGEIVFDPMCGSGTLNVEASLMGIDSYALDISPFCCLMTRVKSQSLSINPDYLALLDDETVDKWFSFFTAGKVLRKIEDLKESQKRNIYELSLLAFLDAMGYARRVNTSDHRTLFAKVLRRYRSTVKQTAENPIIVKTSLGNVKMLDGNAISIPLGDSTVDCVITSPPYSFAIDYAENDSPQLAFLGLDVNSLRQKMLGLSGRGKKERILRYFEDMKQVVGEIVRVTKPGKYITFIIGSNTNQTNGIRLEDNIIDFFEENGAPLVRKMLKTIKGMRNTMKDEYVLIFRRSYE